MTYIEFNILKFKASGLQTPVIMETRPNHWLQFVSSLQDPLLPSFVIYLVDFNVIAFWIMIGVGKLSIVPRWQNLQPIHISKGRI